MVVRCKYGPNPIRDALCTQSSVRSLQLKSTRSITVKNAVMSFRLFCLVVLAAVVGEGNGTTCDNVPFATQKECRTFLDPGQYPSSTDKFRTFL